MSDIKRFFDFFYYQFLIYNLDKVLVIKYNGEWVVILIKDYIDKVNVISCGLL